MHESEDVPLFRTMSLKKGYGPFSAALLISLALSAAGCDVSIGGAGRLTGRATDEWTHTYPLAAGGTVRIGNTNGKIEIEGVDGSTVEVRAERMARAATAAGAREMLSRMTIKEDSKPDFVSVETERMRGIMIGVSTEVRYHVRAPKNATIEVSNTNGLITLTALAGKVAAHTTNGGVSGKGLAGGVDASATNGGVTIEMASLGSEKVALRTTNGAVTLTLPETAAADIRASCTNGSISVVGGNLDVSEQSRRRFEGRLNGGGTSVDLQTINGGVRVRTASGT
jgi:Putative adhesin